MRSSEGHDPAGHPTSRTSGLDFNRRDRPSFHQAPTMASSGEELAGGCRKTGSTPAEVSCCPCEDGTCLSELTKAECQKKCPAGGHGEAEDWKLGWECIK